MREVSNEKIKNVNLETFSKKNFKLKIAAVTTAVLITGVGCLYQHSLNNISLPEGYDFIEKNIYLYSDVTIDSVANLYYTETAREVYPTLDKYKKIIIKNNKSNIIHNNGYGNYISVPIVVSKEDSDYIKMNELIKEKEQVEKNNYWLIAIPGENDTIIKYALKASVTEEEALVLAERIAIKNGFSSINASLEKGRSIWVINSYLGELKKEINEVQEKLVLKDIVQFNLIKNKLGV